jgi:hypothetical protein
MRKWSPPGRAVMRCTAAGRAETSGANGRGGAFWPARFAPAPAPRPRAVAAPAGVGGFACKAHGREPARVSRPAGCGAGLRGGAGCGAAGGFCVRAAAVIKGCTTRLGSGR